MKLVPFPYIVGVPRSGTTLLRAMFSSHPDVVIPDEAGFRINMSLQASHYETSGELDLDLFLGDMFADPQFWWRLLPEQDLRAAIREAEPRTFSDAMRAAFLFTARIEGKSRYGDKTPRGVLAMPTLARLFPEARFIHIVRDGRDVALSHINTHIPTEWFSGNAGEVAITWSDWLLRGRIDGSGLGPGRYREIRYETLVDTPEAALRSLCSYLDLEFDPAMLRYYERPKELLGSTQHNLDFHAALGRPPTKALRDWRTQMSRKDLEIFEAIAGDRLQKLGYPLGCASISPGVRAKAEMVRAYTMAKAAAKGRFGRYRWWPALRLAHHRLLGRR